MKDHIDSLEEGDIFILPLELARPTQFAVGMVAVDCKRKTIEEKHAAGKLKDYLGMEGHLVPIVIGPGGDFYLADHHHLCSSIWWADLPDKDEVYAYVLHDWSHYHPDEFWRAMIDNSLTWLYDEKGSGPLHPHLLPKSIGTILNDPYRTLARWVRDCGCYNKDELLERHNSVVDKEKYFPPPKSTAFFIEFRWANFLRQNVRLKLKHEDFTHTCAAMPYSSLYLFHEAESLEKAFAEVIRLIGCNKLRQVTYDKHGCLSESSPSTR